MNTKPLEIEEPPCAVTERDMQGMNRPNSPHWRRIAPGEKAAVLAKMRARWAEEDAKDAQATTPEPQK